MIKDTIKNIRKVCKHLFVIIFFVANLLTVAQAKIAQVPLSVIISSTKARPNVMLLFDNSNSMRLESSATDPTRRIDQVITVAKDVVDNNLDINLCLAKFNLAQEITPNIYSYKGGTIVKGCTDNSVLKNREDLKKEIGDMIPETGTPLAETYYEITRYFAGKDSFYNENHNGTAKIKYTSPIKYRCQKNFVIALTDGEPSVDFDAIGEIPTDTAASYGLKGGHMLPNWDMSQERQEQDRTKFPRDATTVDMNDKMWSVVYGPTGDIQYLDGPNNQVPEEETGTAFLDDVAKFAYDIDFKRTGNDGAGKPYGDAADANDKSDFPHQNLRTFTIGFHTQQDMLEDAAKYGHGEYYQANNVGQLSAAFNNIIGAIKDTPATAASAVASSFYLTNDDLVYTVQYNAKSWFGELFAYKVLNSADKRGEVNTTPAWKASEQIPSSTTRKIITAKKNGNVFTSVEFKWAKLSATQKIDLANEEERLNYLRGDRSKEIQKGGQYRDRVSPLGDIVHSAPIYVPKKPNFTYPDADYKIFVKNNTTRDEMIYVGANDGMLHGFKADTGVEAFAYVPATVYPHLASLSDADYAHHYFVDGLPIVIDARVGTGASWKTVLLSALGAGGKALFALNVTDPNAATADKFLWEINNKFPLDPSATTPSAMYPDLGYVLTRPSINRVKTSSGDEKWFALTGNGVLSDDNKAVFYVINLNDGTLDHKIEVGDGTIASGLTNITAVDIDGNTYTDRVYAGDLKGNIWRFDWDKTTNKFISKYMNGTAPKPLFRATTASGAKQAITSEFEIGLLPGNPAESGIMLFFGTGRYFENTDVPAAGVATLPNDTFYGVLDDNATSDMTKTNLVQQNVSTTISTTNTRVTSQNQVDWSNKNGWYINLPTKGERVIFRPILVRKHILFVTMIPHPPKPLDPCIPGYESGWFMELDAFSGARPNEVILDINGDGKYDSKDKVKGSTASGIYSPTSAPTTPAIVRNRKSLSKYTGTVDGTINIKTNPVRLRRTSWRQIDQ